MLSILSVPCWVYRTVFVIILVVPRAGMAYEVRGRRRRCLLSPKHPDWL
jgi:hypothetical protein